MSKQFKILCTLLCIHLLFQKGLGPLHRSTGPVEILTRVQFLYTYKLILTDLVLLCTGPKLLPFFSIQWEKTITCIHSNEREKDLDKSPSSSLIYMNIYIFFFHKSVSQFIKLYVHWLDLLCGAYWIFQFFNVLYTTLRGGSTGPTLGMLPNDY